MPEPPTTLHSRWTLARTPCAVDAWSIYLDTTSSHLDGPRGHRIALVARLPLADARRILTTLRLSELTPTPDPERDADTTRSIDSISSALQSAERSCIDARARLCTYADTLTDGKLTTPGDLALLSDHLRDIARDLDTATDRIATATAALNDLP